MNDIKLTNVFRTSEYERFTLIGGNRIIKEVHLAKIKQSMQERYVINPILVNENYEIIDGQHRFTAMKAMNMPVDYIVINGANLDDCQRLNLIGRNWTTIDFVKSHAQQGKDIYEKILSFTEEYDFLSFTNVIYILQGCKRNYDGSLLDIVKSGKFYFTDDEYLSAMQTAEKIKSFKDITELYKNDKFQKSMMQIIWHKDYNHDRLLSKSENLSSKLTSRTSVSEFYELITYIYNYKAREGDKIYFNIEFSN